MHSTRWVECAHLYRTLCAREHCRYSHLAVEWQWDMEKMENSSAFGTFSLFVCCVRNSYELLNWLHNFCFILLELYYFIGNIFSRWQNQSSGSFRFSSVKFATPVSLSVSPANDEEFWTRQTFTGVTLTVRGPRLQSTFFNRAPITLAAHSLSSFHFDHLMWKLKRSFSVTWTTGFFVIAFLFGWAV